ncbi:hypothetical protein ABPG75_011115 [Micractinium tetrahymenae]
MLPNGDSCMCGGGGGGGGDAASGNATGGTTLAPLAQPFTLFVRLPNSKSVALEAEPWMSVCRVVESALARSDFRLLTARHVLIQLGGRLLAAEAALGAVGAGHMSTLCLTPNPKTIGSEPGERVAEELLEIARGRRVFPAEGSMVHSMLKGALQRVLETLDSPSLQPSTLTHLRKTELLQVGYVHGMDWRSKRAGHARGTAGLGPGPAHLTLNQPGLLPVLQALSSVASTAGPQLQQAFARHWLQLLVPAALQQYRLVLAAAQGINQIACDCIVELLDALVPTARHEGRAILQRLGSLAPSEVAVHRAFHSACCSLAELLQLLARHAGGESEPPDSWLSACLSNLAAAYCKLQARMTGMHVEAVAVDQGGPGARAAVVYDDTQLFAPWLLQLLSTLATCLSVRASRLITTSSGCVLHVMLCIGSVADSLPAKQRTRRPRLAGTLRMPCPSFCMPLQAKDDGSDDELAVLSVSRDPQRIVESSFAELLALRPRQLNRSLAVRFSGEPGQGAGVTREWLSLLIPRLFKPELGLFCTCPGDPLALFPSPSASVQEGHLQYLAVAGRVMGLALLHRLPLGFRLASAFYRGLAAGWEGPTFDDLEELEPEVWRSCLEILNAEDAAELALTFTFSCDQLGMSVEVPLSANPNEPVTNSSREAYVAAVARHLLRERVSEELAAVRQGLIDVFTESPARLLSLEELNQLSLGSLAAISAAEWRQHTRCAGWGGWRGCGALPAGEEPGEEDEEEEAVEGAEEPEVLRWFWMLVGAMNEQQRAALLRFWTSLPCLPFGGSDALPMRPRIVRADRASQPLPMAHTCFLELSLPDYPDVLILAGGLAEAVAAAEGFGME